MSTENQDRGDEVIKTEVTPEAAAPATETSEKAAVNAAAEAAAKRVDGEEDKTEGEEKPRDDKGRFIPKSRFDEAVNKERAARETAERQLADLQAQMANVTKREDLDKLEGEIKGLEKQHAKALIDGDEDKAADLASQIRTKERTIQLQTTEGMSATARAQAAEDIRMDMAINTLESTYDILNPENEGFDQDIVDLVLAKQKSLIEVDKMAPSQALVSAAKLVMAKVMPPSRQEPAEKKGLNAAEGAERKEAQVKKNIDTAGKQPASMKEAGKDSDALGDSKKIDPSKLSYEELEALPEATKARLRGDVVEG